MSQSRSPTPSHYHSSNTHTQSTISRPHPLDEQDHARQASASTSRLDTPPTTLAPTPSSSGPQPQSLKRKGRGETDGSFDANTPTTTEDSPMAKRMKHDSPQPRGASRRADRSSPSSSDSQDADTESEATVGATSKMEQAEQSASSTLPGAAPPKKKRTRTLTTPHQSAVLHALLAQSRFPTTAMREEVGRSIGLSARKVQIWFQNQRQKARRPRTATEANAQLNRPPQFGPYPIAPEALLHGQQGGAHSYQSEPSGDHTLHGRLPSETGSMESIPRLLGPGMPGATYPSQPYRAQGHHIPVSAPPTIESSSFLHGPSSQRPRSPSVFGSPRMYPPPAPRPATSQPMSWRERDSSRTLPPLIMTRPSSSVAAARVRSADGPLYVSSGVSHFVPPASSSPEPRFAHHPPEPSMVRNPLHLPPPFTLQPPPQWDESSYLPRPSSSSWSRPSSRSTRGRSTSPMAMRREYIQQESPPEGYYHRSAELPPLLLPLTPSPRPASGRFDPVRASIMSHSRAPHDSHIRTGEHDQDPTPSRSNV